MTLELETRTVNQRVYERLRDYILAGGIGLGERLDERLLAETMRVSRTPIRDAIGKLVKAGLVEHQPYRGNFVRSFTRQEVVDLYELRAELEAMAARLAAERRSDADLGVITDHLAAVSEAIAAADLEAYANADTGFHRLVAELARNEALVAALDQLAHQIRLAGNVANQDSSVVERTDADLTRIADAIAAGDAAGAAVAMREHVNSVGAAVLRRLDG